MKRYALDTNLYVRAFRSQEVAEELKVFFDRFTPGTFLSSVVLHELLVGSNTAAKAKLVERAVALPLKKVGRVITPTHAAWEASGEGIARLARDQRLDLRSVPKSLVNDFLLAASCREAGVTLITDNGTDFKRIRKYVAVDFVGPWPK